MGPAPGALPRRPPQHQCSEGPLLAGSTPGSPWTLQGAVGHALGPALTPGAGDAGGGRGGRAPVLDILSREGTVWQGHSGISEGATRPQSWNRCYCAMLGLGCELGTSVSPSSGPSTTRSTAPSCPVGPRGPAGCGLGKGLQALCQLTQGSPHLLGIRSSAHSAPLLPLPPPGQGQNRG